MMTLLAAGYVPDRLLAPLDALADRVQGSRADDTR
jgi:hypothetical protein